MTLSALLMMTGTMAVVIGIAGYYFWKVLRTPPRSVKSGGQESDERTH